MVGGPSWNAWFPKELNSALLQIEATVVSIVRQDKVSTKTASLKGKKMRSTKSLHAWELPYLCIFVSIQGLPCVLLTKAVADHFPQSVVFENCFTDEWASRDI